MVICLRIVSRIHVCSDVELTDRIAFELVLGFLFTHQRGLALLDLEELAVMDSVTVVFVLDRLLQNWGRLASWKASVG